MSTYVYMDADDVLREERGPVYREHGFAVLPTMADLETHLVRHPEAMLVVLGHTVDLEDALTFAAYQRVQRPALGVVLLRDGVEPDVTVRALRAGIREVVEKDDGDGTQAACARSIDLSKALAVTMRTPEQQAHRGKIITVFAGKGGCGRSVIATNLAAALAAGGSRRILLVDLDLQFGDVGIMLQLPPARTIAAGVSMAGRLDEPGLRSLVTHYRPGIDALLAPASPAEADTIDRALTTEVLENARGLYDFIIVDTPSSVTDHVLTALDLSDWYLAVVTPDLPTLKSARLTLEMFNLLEYPKERRLVVFNRANTQVGLTAVDVEEAVGAQIAVHLPSARDVPVSVNQGEPLALTQPVHPFSRAIRELADRCAGVQSAPAARRRLAFGRRRR